RKAGQKSDNDAVKAAIAQSPAFVVFGSINERMYMQEVGARSMYIPASFPGAVIRRHTGTPFMGYAGAVYIVQEYCNALFDALFFILPHAKDLDQVAPTHSRTAISIAWTDEARRVLDEAVARHPVLTRISAAKTLREAAEEQARKAESSVVELDHVLACKEYKNEGEAA
ncbi:MAG: chlorophyllide reductase subunit Z, partial [Parvularculaceae bacterium]|nr:chlorophyllide reductase subunit Z [Parvularculaceae bacterium]